MGCWGARGYVSPEQLKRTDRELAAMRRERRAQERARIAALSNQDIQKIMARVIVARAAASGIVLRLDFHQAGIPEHRIDNNRDAATRLARREEPRLDAMLRAAA